MYLHIFHGGYTQKRGLQRIYFFSFLNLHLVALYMQLMQYFFNIFGLTPFIFMNQQHRLASTVWALQKYPSPFVFVDEKFWTKDALLPQSDTNNNSWLQENSKSLLFPEGALIFAGCHGDAAVKPQWVSVASHLAMELIQSGERSPWLEEQIPHPVHCLLLGLPW